LSSGYQDQLYAMAVRMWGARAQLPPSLDGPVPPEL